MAMTETSQIEYGRHGRGAERLMAAASGGVILMAVVALDESVRGRVVGLFNGSAGSELDVAVTRASRAVRPVTDFMASMGNESVAPIAFVVVAAVLLVLMLRS
jgi:hypothetical protein